MPRHLFLSRLFDNLGLTSNLQEILAQTIHGSGKRHEILQAHERATTSVKAALRVKRVSSRKELEKAFAIRTRVFVREQGVPEEIEMDRDDNRAFHFLAFEGNKVVGTARLVIRHRSAKIGRMAVLKAYRRRGVGTKLLKRAIVTAKKQGAQKIYLHAQVPVISFYEAVAFRCVGSVFKEAGIPHRKMVFTRR